MRLVKRVIDIECVTTLQRARKEKNFRGSFLASEHGKMIDIRMVRTGRPVDVFTYGDGLA
jgi:hypothetical protein